MKGTGMNKVNVSPLAVSIHTWDDLDISKHVGASNGNKIKLAGKKVSFAGAWHPAVEHTHACRLDAHLLLLVLNIV